MAVRAVRGASVAFAERERRSWVFALEEGETRPVATETGRSGVEPIAG